MDALSLRRGGASIKDIARRLGVSTSTASRWCTEIVLSLQQRKALEKKQGLAAAKALAPWIQKNRALKEADIKKQKLIGQKDMRRMSKRDLLLLGVGLYWGEGYKRGSQEWGFTNSDYGMIRVVLAWLLKCYNIPPERIIARLTLNARYKDEAKRIAHEWAQETGISSTQFGSPTFIQGYSASKLEGRTYRGTLRIKVRRSTSLRRRILASIAEAERQMAPNSRKTAS